MKRMIHFRAFATVTLIVVLHLLSSPSLEGQTGETVKDQKLGITFKAPKNWISIPISPDEHLTIHKYQAKRADEAKKIRGITYTAGLELFFFPVAGAETKEIKEDETEEEKRERELEAIRKISNYEDYIKKRLKREWKVEIKGKPSEKKINGAPVIYYDLMGEIRTYAGTSLPLRFRSALFPTTDGEFVMQFSCLDENYKKRHSKGMESSIRTFRRMEKKSTDPSEGDADRSENEIYIQEQIDKLSSGWYHFWSSGKNYLILSNADKGFARALADQLEIMRDCFIKKFPDKSRVNWIPIVRVCKTQNEYIGYGGMQGSSGYWWDYTREFVFFRNVAEGEKRSFETLRHEAFHQFIHFYVGCPPGPWYNEGNADYYGGCQVVGKRLKAKPRMGRRDAIQRIMTKKGQFPLQSLLNMNHPKFMERPDVGYPQSWSFLYFLLEGKREGARVKKEWEQIPERYLQHLQEALAELETEFPDRKAKENQVNSKLAEGAGKMALDRTFEGWTDKDWKELEEAWINFTK